jgi:hypothetical protein
MNKLRTISIVLITVFLFAPIVSHGSMGQISENSVIESIDTEKSITNMNSYSLAPNQVDADYSRPILHSATYQSFTNDGNETHPNYQLEDDGDLITLRSRNDTLGEGAIIQGVAYANITIEYKVVNGTESTVPQFFSDSPFLNRSLSQGINMNYSKTEVISDFFIVPYSGLNVTGNLTYYTITFNMTSGFVQFFASYSGFSEAADGLRNLISEGQSFTSFSAEEFYIQNEVIEIVIEGINATSSDVYGLRYRTGTPFTHLNFTIEIDLSNDSFVGNVTINDFPVGTVLIWESIAFFNDTLLNETVTVTGFEIKRTEIGDGRPILDLSVDKLIENLDDFFRFRHGKYYTQADSIFLNFSATVPKGDITSFSLEVNNTIAGNIDEINIPFTIINESVYANYTLVFSEESEYNITLTSLTDKDLNISSSFIVVSDATPPEFELISPFLDETISNPAREVTFLFTHSDDLAGINYATIDMGDDSSYEVTNMESFTHRYIKDGQYVIVYTVADNADNIVSTSIIITVTSPEIPDTFASFVGYLMIATALLIPSIFLKRRL